MAGKGLVMSRIGHISVGQCVGGQASAVCVLCAVSCLCCVCVVLKAPCAAP
jgi:hypothetical protein